MDREVIVDLQGLRKSFGDQVILDCVDLQVFAKETLVIIGKSGGGKSVTTRHIVGIEKPDAGKVMVFGKDIARLGRRQLDALRLRIGYLFQSGALLNWMTVEENVELPILEHCPELSKKERQERVLEKLRLVSMESARHKYPSEISGGMKKRAALARAIVFHPELIIYDEPTTGLDPVIASTINDLIVETGGKLGTTQIVVTHDMESAYKIGNRIAMLYEGKIIAQGTPEEIQRSGDPVVRQFIIGDTQGPILEAAET
jgi:phospholipid/cholesterol/gamma-HCH transport system ATP-binding protein